MSTHDDVQLAISRNEPSYAQGYVGGQKISFWDYGRKSLYSAGTMGVEEARGVVIDGIVNGNAGFVWTAGGISKAEFEVRAASYEGGDTDHPMAAKIHAFIAARSWT